MKYGCLNKNPISKRILKQVKSQDISHGNYKSKAKIKMLGNWNGYYKFENERIQKAMGFEKTNFEIIIEKFDGINFDGIVNDDVQTGGMKETGKVTGKIVKNKVSFKKLMPINTQIDLKGERKDMERKHPTLYYSGTLSENKTEIIGTWKFKRKVGFLFGIVPIIFRPGNGSWKMELNTI